MTQDPITRLNAALEGRYRIERQLVQQIRQIAAGPQKDKCLLEPTR